MLGKLTHHELEHVQSMQKHRSCSNWQALVDSSIWQYAGLDPLLDFIKKAIAEGHYKPDPLIPVQITPCLKAVENAKARYLASLNKA